MNNFNYSASAAERGRRTERLFSVSDFLREVFNFREKSKCRNDEESLMKHKSSDAGECARRSSRRASMWRPGERAECPIEKQLSESFFSLRLPKQNECGFGSVVACSGSGCAAVRAQRKYLVFRPGSGKRQVAVKHRIIRQINQFKRQSEPLEPLETANVGH